MKRLLDIILALVVLTVALPVIILAALAVVLIDRHSPVYVSERVTAGGRIFRMLKLRSMRPGADRVGIDIVGAKDPRVTRLGWQLRRFKLDELPQLFNVLSGDMSFVGPRPNTPRHIAMLGDAERELLSVKAGMTDLASIAFSRQAAMFSASADTEADYQLRMRPLKSALGVWYARQRSLSLDLAIVALTVLVLLDYENGLKGVGSLLKAKGAPPALGEAVQCLRLGKWPPQSPNLFGLA